VTQRTGHLSTKKLFFGGLAAGTVALAASLLLRLYVGGEFLPEIASQTLFSLTPGQIESRAVESLGPIAKYSALIGAVVANIILYGLLSLLSVGRSNNKLGMKEYVRNAIRSSLLAYVVLLVIGVVLFALTETDVQTKLGSLRLLAIYLIPSNFVFGFILASFYEGISLRREPTIPKEKHTIASSTSSNTEIDYKKRLLLRAGIASAVALPILYFGLGSLISPRQEVQQSSSFLLSQFQKRSAGVKPRGFEDPRIAPLLASELTPTELFYRIDKNPIVPVVMASTWKLTVKGLVTKPLEINYKNLRYAFDRGVCHFRMCEQQDRRRVN